MKAALRNLVCLSVIGIGGIHGAFFAHRHPAPGVLAAGEPVQEPTPARQWTAGDATLSALASYHIRARVLHAMSYHFGRLARISPVDLALGWGRMSDSTLVDQLSMSQADRFYFYFYSGAALVEQQGYMSTHSANTHMLPANPEVSSRLAWVRSEQVIDATGYLVSVHWPDGSTWTSSLTRDDVGDGACEVFWVEHLEVEDPPG